MPNPIDLKLDGLCHIVADELKIMVPNPFLNIYFPAGKVVIKTDHFFIALHESVDQMGPQKAGTTCYKVSHARSIAESLSL